MNKALFVSIDEKRAEPQEGLDEYKTGKRKSSGCTRLHAKFQIYIPSPKTNLSTNATRETLCSLERLKIQDNLCSIKNGLQKRRNEETMLGEMMHLTALKVNEKRETVEIVKYILLNNFPVEEKKNDIILYQHLVHRNRISLKMFLSI